MVADGIYVDPSGFSIAMNKILDKYGDDVKEVTDRLVKRAGKEARDKLQQTSPKKSGIYAKSWATAEFESSALGAWVTVYNKKKPGLAHLLEHGHALRNGGRTKAIPHIKPVEEEVKQELEKNLRQAIERGS